MTLVLSTFLYYVNRLLANNDIIILRDCGDIKEYLERCMEVEKIEMGVQAKLEAQTISILSLPQTPRVIRIKIIIQIAHTSSLFMFCISMESKEDKNSKWRQSHTNSLQVMRNPQK